MGFAPRIPQALLITLVVLTEEVADYCDFSSKLLLLVSATAIEVLDDFIVITASFVIYKLKITCLVVIFW